MATKKDTQSTQKKAPSSQSPSSAGQGGTRRAQIMKDEGVLPGDKARAADERGKRDDEDALDSGSTIVGSSGTTSRASKGSGGVGQSKKGSKPKGG